MEESGISVITIRGTRRPLAELNSTVSQDIDELSQWITHIEPPSLSHIFGLNILDVRVERRVGPYSHLRTLDW